MAIDDQEEYEQGEQVRNWLRSNGSSVIGGVAVGIALIMGWQWWQGKQERNNQEAAAAYSAFSTAVTADADAKRVGALAGAVHSGYAKTPYATLAAMRMAAYQVEHNDAKGALATLDALGKVSDPALDALVSLRSARVLLILGRPADALSRIKPITDPAYMGVAGEIRGDAERAQGHLDAAREAYVDALNHLPDAALNREIIEMKLADIGGIAPKPEAKKA